MDITPYKKPEYFRNRELSWISFDERVLNEARDKSIPLFERPPTWMSFIWFVWLH